MAKRYKAPKLIPHKENTESTIGKGRMKSRIIRKLREEGVFPPRRPKRKPKLKHSKPYA